LVGRIRNVLLSLVSAAILLAAHPSARLNCDKIMRKLLPFADLASCGVMEEFSVLAAASRVTSHFTFLLLSMA